MHSHITGFAMRVVPPLRPAGVESPFGLETCFHHAKTAEGAGSKGPPEG